VDDFSVSGDFLGSEIHRESVDADIVRRIVGQGGVHVALLGSAGSVGEQVLDAEPEFLEFHGLREVFHGSGFESFDQVHGLPERGQEYYRDFDLAAAEHPHEAYAVELGHHPVEDDEVDLLVGVQFFLDQFKSALPVEAGGCGDSLDLQIFYDI
jgi:hypothetical protein